MARTIVGGAKRKTVACTNEDCPSHWRGQRSAKAPEEAPCPVCSSAVAVVDGPAQLEPPPEEPAGRRRGQTLPPPFTGIPRVSVGEVRIGLAAHQRLGKLELLPQHRGRPRHEIAGWLLDQWGAGLLGVTEGGR